MGLTKYVGLKVMEALNMHSTCLAAEVEVAKSVLRHKSAALQRGNTVVHGSCRGTW